MNYMEVNTQIINSVKEWVKLDNEMRTLKEELNIRKKKKDNISNGLLQSMKEKEIDSFDLVIRLNLFKDFSILTNCTSSHSCISSL